MTAAPGPDDTRLWVQVVRGILGRLERGELKPGDTVPPRSELCADLDVSVATVTLAMRFLARQGIVRRGHQSRYRVTSSACEHAAVAAAAIPGSTCGRAVVVSPGRAALIVEACTAGGMTREQAGAAYGIGRDIVSRVLREQGGLLRPAEAALVAGISTRKLRELAAAGEVRSVSYSGYDGRWLYYRDDMLALASSAARALRRAVTLDDLVLAWGAEWDIGRRTGGTWRAIRLDGRGEPLTAASAERLNALVRAGQEREVAAR